MCDILIIDDEKMIAELIRQALSRFGCAVEIAASGEEGIQKYDGGNFNLVITDICMPGTNGLEVLRHIRNSKRKETPTIGISGTPWLLKGSDFDFILSKPFSLYILYDIVEKLTGETVGLAATA